MPTDRLFTGQRLDGTGLYYYGARYYDPTIGRFISPDPIVQSPANPQTLNRYSYVLNNPLKYIDPSGLNVEIGDTDISDLNDIVDEILLYDNEGSGPPPDLIERLIELMEGLGKGGIDIWNDWERLKREEQEYTQHMEESEITFNVVGIDLSRKTISYLADMPLLNFEEPVQLRFVSAGPMFLTMKYILDDATGISLYPGPIRIRTDISRTAESFTWLVAHESYHRWEQSLYVNSYWYERYIQEIRGPHASWSSEQRATRYANRYYQR